MLPLKEDLPKQGKEGYGIAKRAVKPKMFTTTGKKCPVMLLEKLLSRHLPELKNCGSFYFSNQRAKFGLADSKWVNTKLDKQ